MLWFFSKEASFVANKAKNHKQHSHFHCSCKTTTQKYKYKHHLWNFYNRSSLISCLVSLLENDPFLEVEAMDQWKLLKWTHFELKESVFSIGEDVSVSVREENLHILAARYLFNTLDFCIPDYGGFKAL